MMALQSMGRQHGDRMVVGGDGGGGGGGAASSSIALLQERFRQLQRMRERREEVELLKLLSESEKSSRANKYYERSGNMLVNHDQMVYHKPTTAATTTSCFQDSSLSLGLDLYGKKTEHQPSRRPPSGDFWSIDSVAVSTSRTHDKPDVDTSLHL